MSYDIYIYVRSFLERAPETGDWTDPPPLPPAAVEALLAAARSKGFTPVPGGPAPATGLVAGVDRPSTTEIGTDELFAGMEVDTDELSAHLNVFRGEAAFTITMGKRFASSIEVCLRIARRVADEHGLAVWDPQEPATDADVWIETLRTGDPTMRIEATRHLAAHDPAVVAGPLSAAARDDPDEDVRRCALEAIGDLGEAAASTIDEVMACLADPSPIIQYWATYALGRLGPLAAVALPALEGLIASTEHGPRYGALDAIDRLRAVT